MPKDEFTKKLENTVASTKENDACRREYMMRNLAFDDYYDRGVAVGVDRGIQQGMLQGEHNARIETARNFLVLGIATQEQIAQATGLSLEEVQHIQRTSDNS